MDTQQLVPSRESRGVDESLPSLVSFVVPARNEGRTIQKTLDSIHAVTEGQGYAVEIVVIDNASTDETVAVSRQASANVIIQEKGTIGHLRNIGAASAEGDILVFIDADVWLPYEWRDAAPAAFRRLRAHGRDVIGSICEVPQDPSWVERYWFQPRLKRPTHVGSGHMIVRRDFFFEMQGFDESLETGEDYDFCVRATQAGGEVLINPDLRAVHEGFPKTLLAFVRREAWHGASDFSTVGRIVKSKVALATIVFVLMHCGAVASLIMGNVTIAVAFVMVTALGSTAFALYKQGLGSPRRVIGGTMVSYFYFLGRSLAFLKGILLILRTLTFNRVGV